MSLYIGVVRIMYYDPSISNAETKTSGVFLAYFLILAAEFAAQSNLQRLTVMTLAGYLGMLL